MVRGWVVRGFSSVASLFLLSTAPRTAGAAEPPNTIRVVARDTIAANPDLARLELGVTTSKKTAAAAISENDRKMEQVVAVLKKEVGADGEVKTSELSVEPRFEETKSGETTQRILGYKVTHIVHVRTPNIRTVGRLLDVAFQAGANTLERVDFALKDPEAAQNQALRGASAKARARATAIAEGQGLHVGDVIWVSEGEVAETREDFEKAKMGYEANLRRATLVPEAGAIDVTATVTVVFALKR